MTFPMPLKIVGVGRYVPERVVPSTELDARLDLREGWIEEKQGIRERRWATDETSSFMAAEAVREAVADAGMELSDIDLIFNASGTPEQVIPDGSALIQRQLGLGESGVSGMSLHTTCLSFLVAMDVTASLLATDRYKNVVIVSSEISSVGLNWSHPESSTLFGDAAAAAVVTRTPEGEASCVHAARLETYGAGAEHTQIPGGGSAHHPNKETTTFEDNLFHMNGPEVFKMAIKYAPPFLERLLPDFANAVGALKVVVPHQASKLALDSHTFLGMPEDKVARTLDRFGNCIAASIPLTLYEVIRAGRIERGDKFLLLGTGAGLSLGGVVATY
jgi:3-oxoacyl-[acyl-carrier-protein] synthase III